MLRKDKAAKYYSAIIIIMIYILMHTNKVVLSFELTEKYDIDKVIDVWSIERCPIGTLDENNNIITKKLNAWLSKRTIPEARDGISKFNRYLKEYNMKKLAIENYALSLSDKYWIKTKNENVSWENINFFTNRFSYDIGNIIFGDRHLDLKDIDFMSPDLTTNGWLKKAWRIKNNKRFLIKTGSAPFYQEPLNEVLASELLTRLNFVDFVKYDLTYINKKPCSICENFIDENTEFIPAVTVYKTRKRDEKNESIYEHLIERCNHFKIPGAVDFIDKMLIIDCLIMNEDRHLGNFGFLRNANTLEFIGPAPLFDNGTSFFNNANFYQIPHVLKVCRPFNFTWDKQINLINGYVDLSVLNDFDITKYLNQSQYVEERRIDLINNEFSCNKELLIQQLNKNKEKIKIVQKEEKQKNDISL